MSYHIDDTDGTTIPTAVKVEKTITLRELTVEEANGTVLAWDKNTGFHVAWFDGVCWIEHGRSVQTPDRVWELPEVEGK